MDVRIGCPRNAAASQVAPNLGVVRDRLIEKVDVIHGNSPKGPYSNDIRTEGEGRGLVKT